MPTLLPVLVMLNKERGSHQILKVSVVTRPVKHMLMQRMSSQTHWYIYRVTIEEGRLEVEKKKQDIEYFKKSTKSTLSILKIYTEKLKRDSEKKRMISLRCGCM